MNLRTFHLVFITFSCALAVAFGLWALGPSGLAGAARLAAAAGAFAVALALVVYETWFLRTTRSSR